MSSEKPSLVDPTANQEMFVSGKVFGGVGVRIKAGDPLNSPAVLSLVSGKATLHHTMAEMSFPVGKARISEPGSHGDVIQKCV